ncbi:hypothetical protein N7449_005331 [Penicillium cf. viridicatum]|uniref:Protein kinase domain-containing protein n=1 Tax=Penicillium cf. viridicatum TaxID=2972119 RepID=A0A9W9SZ15_9EURO|nr:hypothetical protein N7449_005331 [Penicillium cf. viridicatum]
MGIDFVTQRHFLPLLVLEQLYASPQLRQVFRLNGNVAFENHANTLTDESNIVADMGSLSLAQEQPRRSRRLAAKQSHKSRLPLPAQPVVKHQGPALRKPSRPRADQFCVYNKGPNEKVPAFIVEYKAPHKLTLAHIKAGLREMELDQVVRYQEVEKPEHTCQRVVAAVITQAFSYMINGGMEYGYVCTGEAFIFLRVPHDDPSTVYYYLSVSREKTLHLTALGQVLAFTLRALQTPQRGIQWQNWAASKLDTWEMIHDDPWGEISELDVPSSVFKSPQSRSKYCRVSPVKTRSKSTVAGFASCTPLEALSSSESDDSPDGSDPNTPSRQPQSSRFADSSALSPSSAATNATRWILLKWQVSPKCPNVLDHGVGRHPISQATLIRLSDRQLSRHDSRPDLDIGCESLHIHGTRGGLFKVTLLSHGYTFVGKGAPIEFVEHAQHEECVYSRLRPIQGVHVPVLLGGLALRQPFSYDGIAEIVHLMLMGYAGGTLAKRHEIDQNWLIRRAEISLHDIHGLGVLHNDPIPGNMVWNEDSSRVMYIDFERAQFQDRRAPLESMSPNQKRKQATQSWEKTPNKRSSCFDRETRRMRHALRW